jgi:hypothetical protein
MERNSAPTAAIDQETFVSRAFPETSMSLFPTAVGKHATSVGISPDLFAAYLDFLAQNTGGEIDDDPDTIAALVFETDQDGGVRYWIEPDMLSYAMTISRRIREMNQKDEPDLGHGFSPGRQALG